MTWGERQPLLHGVELILQQQDVVADATQLSFRHEDEASFALGSVLLALIKERRSDKTRNRKCERVGTNFGERGEFDLFLGCIVREHNPHGARFCEREVSLFPAFRIHFLPFSTQKK